MISQGMATTEVTQLLTLLDRAFASEDWHSLLTNLRTTMPMDWDGLAEGGQRSIRSIVQHVGGCKFMYENDAFGDGTLQCEDPLVTGEGALTDLPAVIPWLRLGQGRLRESVAALSDADLDVSRLTNWGKQRATRWIITVMIEHDIYHAGEINLLRSLQTGDDRWAYDRLPDEHRM